MKKLISTTFLLLVLFTYGYAQKEVYKKAKVTGKGAPHKPCKKMGSIFDYNSGKCYMCPEGFKRTKFAVTGDKACVMIKEKKVKKEPKAKEETTK